MFHTVPHAMRVAPTLNPLFQPLEIQAKHALLINPFYAKDPHASFGKHVLTPTLALTSIAASTPEDWTVELWDENLLQGPPPCRPFPAVVGITVHLTFAKRAFELSRWYRERGAKVILGGLHVLSCPDECRPHADAIAVGEGTQLWGQILRDISTHQLKPRYEGTYRKPYRDDPPPRRSLLPRGQFLTTTSLNATRGCHNRCGFCYLATDGLTIPYQTRDISQIVSEFLDDDQPYAVFTDNNLGSRPDFLKELSLAIKPLGKIWSAAVSIDVTDRPDVIREMARSGCTGVFIGFESLHPENITDSRKKSPRPDDYARRVKLLHDHGIQVNGSFVFGFDHDGPDVFDRTADWIEANRLECATFHILTPYPGTPLFAQMESEGRLLHRDWSLYDTGHVVFQPKLMTPEQLFAGYTRAYRRLFSMASIWRRRPHDKAAILPYLAMSYLYKKSNWLWYFLIRYRLTSLVWRPLVEITRKRHVKNRHRFNSPGIDVPSTGAVVSAGV